VCSILGLTSLCHYYVFIIVVCISINDDFLCNLNLNDLSKVNVTYFSIYCEFFE
jgi:hypothetical protein